MTEPAKYITKVEIQGLFGRYDIEWNLNKDVNVLAGINGSGKSTILDNIHGVVSGGKFHSIEKIKVFISENDFFYAEKIFIVDSFKNINKKASNGDLKHMAVLSRLKHHQSSVVESHESSIIEFNGFMRDSSGVSNESKQSLSLNIIRTFDTEVKTQELLQKADELIKTELDFELWQLQRQYLNYQVNLGKKLKANKGKPDDNSTYFQDKFLEIVDNLFSETNKKVNRDKNELEFLLGDKEINAYQLSSGEKQILVILLTVLVQDNKPSILLMDEPEISLHIEWQRKLIQYVRELNPNAQVIVATHSPDIVPDGCLDKIFNLQDLIVKDNLVP
jgi:predicted ATP-dependent endonuclease of OLD family